MSGLSLLIQETRFVAAFGVFGETLGVQFAGSFDKGWATISLGICIPSPSRPFQITDANVSLAWQS